MTENQTRHEFLTLTDSWYDGIGFTVGSWYCACGKWQFTGDRLWRSRQVHKAKEEFLAHLQGNE